MAKLKVFASEGLLIDGTVKFRQVPFFVFPCSGPDRHQIQVSVLRSCITGTYFAFAVSDVVDPHWFQCGSGSSF
jgi:hypothetical protein